MMLKVAVEDSHVAHGLKPRWWRVAIAVGLVLTLSGQADATEYSPPWADALWGHWPGSSGLDTTGTMNGVKANLSPDYDAFSTNPSTAHAALGTAYAQSDAIWWMAGHGDTGYITTYNSTNATTVVNVSNSVPGSSCSSPDTCLTSYTSSQLHAIRLMVFQGCDSGAALSNGDRLPKRAVNTLGVDSAVGFSAIISFSNTTSDIWASYFTTYGMGSGYDVNDAAWGATNEVYFYSGDYNGYDAVTIYGGSVHIHPAQYGS